MVRKLAVKVRFRRDVHSSYEDGIAIGPDTGSADVIVDSLGFAVPESEVWNFITLESEGLMWFNLGT